MQLRRILPALVAAALPAAMMTVGTTTPASAALVGTADYSASADSSVVSTHLTVGGTLSALVPTLPGTVSATVGEASAQADTSTPVTTSADGANVAAGAVGLDLTRGSGHAEQPGGPATDDWTTAAHDLAPVASFRVISGTTAADWDGLDACVPDGTPLSRSSTTVAGADLLPLPTLLGIAPLTGASLSSATTTSRTELVANGGADDSRDVVSTAAASPVDVALLSGAVDISLTSDATLTSTATGTAATTTTTYSPPTATVTVGGSTETLTVGTPKTETVSLLGGSASAKVTLTLNQPDLADSGLTASGSVSVLSVALDVSVGSTSVVTGSLDLFPLGTSATAPDGGVQCTSPIAPPVVVTPPNGAWTTPTPTLAGTGIPGATVHVLLDGAKIGDVTADQAGDWSLPWTGDALTPGSYDASARQTVQGELSGLSNVNTFHVAIPPVITSPPDGSTTADRSPTITGTGQPGATVEVFVDGQDLGPAAVDGNGDWSLPVTSPLSYGDHDVDATQTDAGGNTQDAPQVTFTVVTSGRDTGGGDTGGGDTGGGPGSGDKPDAGSQPGPRPAADELADTGAPAGMLWVALLGTALVAAGGYALRRSRA